MRIGINRDKYITFPSILVRIWFLYFKQIKYNTHPPVAVAGGGLLLIQKQKKTILLTILLKNVTLIIS